MRWRRCNDKIGWRRASCHYLAKYIEKLNLNDLSIFVTENVTPLFSWVENRYNEYEIIGTEYLGRNKRGGIFYNGIRHEDIENLSFEDNRFNIVLTNDVLEHVSDPQKAIRELARVIKKNGYLLMSVPFNNNQIAHIQRARYVNGDILFLKEPEYHDNPLSKKGSLVYYDFGWNLLPDLVSGGFSDAYIQVFWSYEYGYLGGAQINFVAIK